jgi:hypothetical protein
MPARNAKVAPQACEPLGVESIHPDDFLLDLHDLNPGAVRAALEQQAADLTRPGRSSNCSAHAPRQAFLRSSRPSAAGGSLPCLMSDKSAHTKRPSDQAERRPLTEIGLGTGFGDRFEGSRGASGVFEGGMHLGDETA